MIKNTFQRKGFEEKMMIKTALILNCDLIFRLDVDKYLKWGSDEIRYYQTFLSNMEFSALLFMLSLIHCLLLFMQSTKSISIKTKPAFGGNKYQAPI